ncbi:aromatic ring-hydroxylating dioxygenase subunit alpha [Pusillimonas noertemannii]|uniref:Phenylpropionate dioxygenase-like ring-hydroxylating dioxygenase large terminal subunit n=1 Tax=Pusillimonas noertemannii TaxID=305977 RepID=A0A2U1CJI3_9BURK|nr:aromatic ring-hydroxylating dioxygenase subunit alpha [Pusillimonas noertemannii]NYT69915.1 Rieske 2Fe-2S domain-containing protein [Pusillimonas noertemannii]PVY61161.1 phenylpropionate dioxygenase-like ring-hydroxylating dioxygenase large terminal subunit [Pusillimonas noertemannii]TFL09209.1 ribosomal subunit interface protein [Pusillimonas noertemannii]
MSYSNESIAGLVRPDSVHKSVYTDPEIFQLEMDRIYGHAWIYAGHESQVPKVGDYHTTRIGDQDVIMVRGVDNKVHVLYNRCPHKGAMLVARGDGNAGKFFRCPYHAWTFKLDGSHLAAPIRRGFEGTRFDPASPEFSMRALARVENYRGFVFASQAAEGPSLSDFLGGVRSSIDNLCDRSPEGEVEVAGGVFKVMQPSNWKVFYENLHDTMHANVTHESSYTSAREQAEAYGSMPLELHIMDGNGEPYDFWEKLSLMAFDYGHGYMEGIFNPGAIETDPVTRSHFESLEAAYGRERALAILGENRHNTIIYGSGSPHTVFQQFRVIRPISVDRTMVEIQTFRLKGAPEAIFKRGLMYANLINSPSSNVMPDDIELYGRCQQGNQTRGGDWVSQHRYAGTDKPIEGGMTSINGTSELPMRNQFQAWKQYMLGEI